MPGYTTHRLQPLDVAFFKLLQNYYVQAQELWMRANPGTPISVYNLAALIGEAYGRAATVGTTGAMRRQEFSNLSVGDIRNEGAVIMANIKYTKIRIDSSFHYVNPKNR